MENTWKRHEKELFRGISWLDSSLFGLEISAQVAMLGPPGAAESLVRELMSCRGTGAKAAWASFWWQLSTARRA